MCKNILCFVFLFCTSSSLAFRERSVRRSGNSSQLLQTGPTLQERLGYSADSKLVIIHTDDIGVCHSVNRATFESLENGFVNSGSIMVPCPWFPEVADYFLQNPQTDLGLHLTLTSEWDFFKWGGTLSVERAPSLVNDQEFLYPAAQDVVDHANLTQVEAELHAQIQRALNFGILPTHFDTHMGTLREYTIPLFDIYLRVGRAYRTPVFVARNNSPPELLERMTPQDILVEGRFTIPPSVAPEDWDAFYTDVINDLPIGVSVIIIHVGYDDEELQGVTVNQPGWGAAWRQRDMDFFMNPIVKELLIENNIELITWRDIQRIM